MKTDNLVKLARFLGWFSIGLGVTELVAPDALNRFLGTRRPGLTRAFGLREIAAGIGILSQRRLAPWLWARVAGDALDLAALAAGLRGNRKKAGIAVAASAVAGVTALDVLAAQRLRA